MDDRSEAMLAYISTLERAIMLAADELRPGGDPEYAARILWTLQNRILAAEEAAELETEAARQGALH